MKMSDESLPETRKNHLLAVIPAYNEEIAIGSVVLQTRSYVDTVIVVDDGSQDETAEVAALAGAEVIRLRQNMGKAHALLTGFRRAQELMCDAVIMLDGDGQHLPLEIPTIAAPVLAGEADLVVGSRFINSSSTIPRYRLCGQKVLNLFTNLTSNHKVTDSQSGFRALNPDILYKIDFPSNGYSIDSDMIAHLSSQGVRIKEVPITALYDVPNKHKKNPLTHGIGVLSNLVIMLGSQKPLAIFAAPGTFFIVAGALLGSQAFGEYYLTAKFPYVLSLLTGLFLIFGLLLVTSGFILQAIVSIMLSRERSAVPDPPRIEMHEDK